MPFEAACPFCPTRINRVPDEALGASLRCPQCGNYFTLAPADDLNLQPAGKTFRRPTARAAPNPSSASDASEAGHSEAAQLSTAHPVSPTCGSAAAYAPRSQLTLWLRRAAVVSLVVLTAALFWSRGPSRQGRIALVLDDPDPHQFLVVTPDNRQMIRDLGRSEWADAEKESLRQGNVHIRICWAKVDVPPRNETAKPSSLPRSLLIQVQLAHLPPELRPFKGLLNGNNTPVLLDDRGRKYALRSSPPQVGIADQVDLVPSSSREPVQEVLVFEPPGADLESLKLDLPAMAWGRTGSCRFRIPRSMIEQNPQAQ